MRAAVFFGANDVRRVDRLLPEPGSGEARLRVLLAGVCATDRHIVLGHFPVRPPRILGHEIVGTVDAVGPGVSADWLGRECGVCPARFCGECSMCAAGSPQLCRNFECLGNTHDGGYAEYTLARTDQLAPLNGLAPEAGVWLEPLACVVQALEQAELRSVSGRVLVLGAGVLGRLMIQAICALSGRPPAVIDPNPDRIASALAVGAETGWAAPRFGPAPDAAAGLARWAPEGPALVIDTSGSPEAIRRAAAWAGPRGRVLLFGVSNPAAEVCLAPQIIFAKELTLTASSGMAPRSFAAAEDLLRSRRIDPLIQPTASAGLDDLPEYLVGRRGMPAAKLLIRPWSDAEAAA